MIARDGLKTREPPRPQEARRKEQQVTQWVVARQPACGLIEIGPTPSTKQVTYYLNLDSNTQKVRRKQAWKTVGSMSGPASMLVLRAIPRGSYSLVGCRGFNKAKA